MWAVSSSVLTAFADIMVELRRLNTDDPADCRRVPIGFSRYAQTPPALRLELSAESTEYLRLPDPNPDAFSDNRPMLRAMLEDTCFKLTRSHIREESSSDYPMPHSGTLASWLDRAVERGLLKRQAAGRKSVSFYYWLPECEGRLLGRRDW